MNKHSNMASEEITTECITSEHSNIPSDETSNTESSLEQIVLLLSHNAWIYNFKLTRFFLDRVWEHLPSEVSTIYHLYQNLVISKIKFLGVWDQVRT